MCRALAAFAAAASLAALAGGCGSVETAGPVAPAPSSIPRSQSSHVLVVVMENKEQSDVIGSTSAPYTNALANRFALAINFFAITHPSLPNYLALTGGSTFGVSSDCTGCHQHASNLVDQLERAGISWRAYMEGMPHPCYKGAGSDGYAKKHDPFAYYDDVVANARRCGRIVPGSRLSSDLRSGRLPTFAWITPDLCHDTHDCSVAVGDRYLSRLVPALLRALGPHGVLFLTWDEGDSDAGCCGGIAGGGRVATIVAGPDVRSGARPSAAYTHYSTLRTLEQILALRPLRLAGSPRTASLSAAFTRLPRIRRGR